MAKAKQPRTRRRASRSRSKPARRRAVAKPPPAGFTAAEAARLLRLPLEVLTRHIAQGAPVDGDGHLELVHYAAWLNGQAPGQSNDADRPDETESD